MHVSRSLKEGGKAGVVVDRGTLINGGNSATSWQGKFRKWLVENNNLYKIISLPSGIFEYTSFATCILFFVKGEKTKSIKYYEAEFEYNKKILKELPEEAHKTITLKELKENKYCFNLNIEKENNDGNDNNESENTGLQKVKLGDIITDIKVGKDIKKENLNGTIFKYFGANGINGYFDDEKLCGFNGEYVLLGAQGSIGKTFYVNEKFHASHNTWVIGKSDKYSLLFLHYYFKYAIDFDKLNTGSGIPCLSKNSINNIEINLPSLEDQKEIAEFIKTRNLDLKESNKIFEKDKKTVLRLTLMSIETEKVKLGNILDEIKIRKRYKKENLNGILYPYYGEGINWICRRIYIGGRVYNDWIRKSSIGRS